MRSDGRLKQRHFLVIAASGLLFLLQGCGDWLKSPQPDNHQEVAPTPTPNPDFVSLRFTTASNAPLPVQTMNVQLAKGSATNGYILPGTPGTLMLHTLNSGDEVYFTLDFGVPYPILQMHYFIDNANCATAAAISVSGTSVELCGPTSGSYYPIGGGSDGIIAIF